MRKLILTCDCGQQMQVPRSAIGKMGMCPACGRTVKITTSNTAASGKRSGPSVFTSPRTAAGKSSWHPSGDDPPEDARQRFGQAVDYYYAGRYAEALAIFDGLLREFPGNADVSQGRNECIKAMARPPRQLPHYYGTNTQPAAYPDGRLDEATVRRIVLDKMLRGTTEAVQLQAAELAAKILGMIGGKPARSLTREELAGALGEGASNGHGPAPKDQPGAPEESHVAEQSRADE